MTAPAQESIIRHLVGGLGNWDDPVNLKALDVARGTLARLTALLIAEPDGDCSLVRPR